MLKRAPSRHADVAVVAQRWVLAAALLLMAGCGPSSIPPASQYGTVSGRVYDAVTNQPIAGAAVTINSVQSAFSDGQGAYAIPNVPGGPTDWSADGGAAYVRMSGTFSLPPGQQKYTLDIPLVRTH